MTRDAEILAKAWMRAAAPHRRAARRRARPALPGRGRRLDLLHLRPPRARRPRPGPASRGRDDSRRLFLRRRRRRDRHAARRGRRDLRHHSRRLRHRGHRPPARRLRHARPAQGQATARRESSNCSNGAACWPLPVSSRRSDRRTQRIVRDLASLQGSKVNYLSLMLVQNPKRERGALRRGCRSRREAAAAAAATD
jgi:hypothetical protein